MNLVDRLKRFDTNGSVAQEFRVYTVQGAVFSVLTLVSILYLVTTEAYFNFQIDVQQLLHVNATSPVGVPMEFDITIHSVRCSDLSIDAQDPAGQSQSMHLDRNHHVWKHRVRRPDDTNSRGPWQLIGSPKQLELGSTLLDLQDVYRKIDRNMQIMGLAEGGTTEPCGSCYGAGEPGECCNTCDDVKRAYKLKGWGLANQAEVLQCQEEAKAAAEEQEGEGCNVHGIVALDSGGGNLHLAPGEEMATGIPRTSASLFDLLLAQFHEWNVTHTINKIRFGPHYPGAKYQLDGQERVIADSHGMYQYYVQIVPTRYRFLNGTTIQTNQYSVTEHLRHVHPGSNRGLPGVYFFYEVSPLHVEIYEGYRKGWIAFFTSVCAVVGGVVTVMGMLDQWLFARKHREHSLAL